MRLQPITFAIQARRSPARSIVPPLVPKHSSVPASPRGRVKFTSQAELNSTSLLIVLKFLVVDVTLRCLSKKLLLNLESLCFVL